MSVDGDLPSKIVTRQRRTTETHRPAILHLKSERTTVEDFDARSRGRQSSDRPQGKLRREYRAG